MYLFRVRNSTIPLSLLMVNGGGGKTGEKRENEYGDRHDKNGYGKKRKFLV